MEASNRLRRNYSIRKLASLLSGETAFVTGGTVRDVVLGLKVREVDLALLGDAEGFARRLAGHLGGVFFPLGKKPRVTFRVMAPALQVDVWPVPGNLKEDVLRRDFTVNALFFRLPSGPLLDLVGGLADLARGKLEVIRPQNLLDDPLRVLRGLRLILTRPLRLSHTSVNLLRGASTGLTRVPRERIREEMDKLLSHAPLWGSWEKGLDLGIWQALGVCYQDLEGDPKPVIQRVDDLAQRSGVWQDAATTVRWLGMAAARILGGEAPEAAVANALVPLGVAGRQLAKLHAAARTVEELLAAPTPKAVLACYPPQRAVLAWYFARNPSLSWAQVPRLWRWWVGFHRRPPLLPSREVVELLNLPEGPQRGEVIRELRQLQAVGKVRTPTAARSYLLRHRRPPRSQRNP